MASLNSSSEPSPPSHRDFIGLTEPARPARSTEGTQAGSFFSPSNNLISLDDLVEYIKYTEGDKPKKYKINSEKLEALLKLESTLVYSKYIKNVHPSSEVESLLFEMGIYDTGARFASEEEGGAFSVGECKDHGLIMFPRILGGAHNPYMIWKSGRNSALIQKKKLCRLKGRDNLKILKLVLTCPEKISRLYTACPEVVEKKLWEAIELFREKLKEEVGCPEGKDMGFSFNLHPWKSEEPDGKPHPHFHGLIPWIIANKKLRQLSKLIENSQMPYKSEKRKKELFGIERISEENITIKNGDKKRVPISESKIKNIWAECLREIFDIWIGKKENHRGEEVSQVDTQLKYIKKSEGGKLLHRLRYKSRKPLLDLNDFSLSHDRKLKNKRWCRYLVDYQNKTRVYGFWRNLKYLLEEEEEDEEEERRCPFCDKLMCNCKTVTSRELPKFSKIIRKDGVNIFVWTRPPPEDEKKEEKDVFVQSLQERIADELSYEKIYSHEQLLSNFNESQIKKAKFQGYIFEPFPGNYRLV